LNILKLKKMSNALICKCALISAHAYLMLAFVSEWGVGGRGDKSILWLSFTQQKRKVNAMCILLEMCI
jgi:hypothetical protein